MSTDICVTNCLITETQTAHFKTIPTTQERTAELFERLDRDKPDLLYVLNVFRSAMSLKERRIYASARDTQWRTLKQICKPLITKPDGCAAKIVALLSPKQLGETGHKKRKAISPTASTSSDSETSLSSLTHSTASTTNSEDRIDSLTDHDFSKISLLLNTPPFFEEDRVDSLTDPHFSKIALLLETLPS